MNAVEIEQAITDLAEQPFDRAEFPYAFLEAFGNKATTLKRLRAGAVLADAMKRIGIVERSGRGVDRIYRGMLRFGRPEPDYSRTDGNNVVLQLSTVEADEGFLELVVEQEGKLGSLLPIDSLIALAALREQKRLSADELARHIHRGSVRAKRTLEQLVEAGLVDAHGTARDRSYTLSVQVYRVQGERMAYTRQAGFSDLQHEQMVLSYVHHHGRIQRNEVVELCHLNRDQAKRLLRRLKVKGKLIQHGVHRGTYYTLGENASV